MFLNTLLLRTNINPASKRTLLKAAMSTSTPPVPIALIGIHTSIGEPVAAALRPDYDVTRFVQTFEAAKADLPHLLRGSEPPTAPTNAVGSHDYSRPVRAVLFGRGFTQQEAETLYGLYKDVAPSVLWVAGAETGRPPGGVVAEPPPGVEKIVVPVFRGVLEKWVQEGAEKGGLVLY
ncbi:hypothetical protein F5B17DRAFT_405790 [Nemania serpens]|nr:hypothetical protein F5B17DRAFT_405790 [Nemania serpens]